MVVATLQFPGKNEESNPEVSYVLYTTALTCITNFLRITISDAFVQKPKSLVYKLNMVLDDHMYKTNRH